MSIIHCESISVVCARPCGTGESFAEVTVGVRQHRDNSGGKRPSQLRRDRFDKAVVKWRRNPIVDRP